jgi:predicted homoserine dehydrogenase-like protein
MLDMGKETRVGIIGTGFIARGLMHAIKNDEGLTVSKVLTRRNLDLVKDTPLNSNELTNSVDEIIENSDIVVECSGDPIHATNILSDVIDNKIPVVTMNAELHVTSGSWLAKKGFITEAEGDQPGSIAALYKDVIAMGFNPVVLGNIKGFLNEKPTKEDMEYYSSKQGISLEQVTAFTDGTKIQIEQTLVANGLGADILRPGLTGIECDDYRDGAQELAKMAGSQGVTISDYVLSAKSPAGVFITATHNEEQAPFLKYYKLGDGPYYTLTRPFHLCHLEIIKSIRQVVNGDGILLNNSKNPNISVSTIAKRTLVPGDVIKRGIGSFDVRGEAVRISENLKHVPIGLMFDVVIKRKIESGQTITFDDVEIPESKTLIAWQDILKNK